MLASRILSHIFGDMDVKLSEVHGMAQRGGSVVTTVRAAETVHTPLIADGEADILIAMEYLEGLRYAHALKPGGRAVVSTQKIMPLPVLTGAAPYPSESIENAILINALALASEAGSPKAANVVLIGAASVLFDFPDEKWFAAIEAHVKPKFLDANKKAFKLGREAAKKE